MRSQKDAAYSSSLGGVNNKLISYLFRLDGDAAPKVMISELKCVERVDYERCVTWNIEIEYPALNLLIYVESTHFTHVSKHEHHLSGAQAPS
jgi:hypothetical protein